MKLTLSKPRDAPFPPFHCDLVEIDIESIPFMLNALWVKEQRYNWTTEEDAKRGRQMLAKQGAQMLMGCADRIVESVDRLYRLTDSIHNGVIYAVSGSGTTLDPHVYSPPMPLVPATEPGAEPSVKFSLEKALRLQDNLVNGTTYADAPDERNLRQQLDDIITALGEAESLDPEILAELVQILAALA